MFKWKKMLFLVSTSTAFLPIIALSASKKGDQVSPQFSEFKKRAKEAVKKALTDGLTNIAKQLEEIKSSLDKETNFKKKLSAQIYLEKLIDYVTKNKTDIIAHPENYGFPITFLNIISQDKKYHVGNIEYNNRQYKDVAISKNAPYDYVDAIKPDGVITKKKDKNNAILEEDNFIKSEDFDKVIKSFENELIKKFNSIIFNSKDIPELDKDFSLDLEKLKEGIIKYSTPKGFGSWDDYIKSKIKPRYVAFDLEQNEKSNEEEEQNENKDPNPADKPPLVPGDNPNAKYKTEIENIAQLPPYIAHGYSQYTHENLKQTFDTLTDDKAKQNLFFFDNPINSRYLYKVESLSINSGKLIANVSITDKVDTSKKRRYNAKLNVDSSSEYQAWLQIYSEQIKSLNQKFLSLYKALDLDDKLNYEMLRSNALVNALFRTVDAAIKFYLKKEYKDEQMKLVQYYAQYISTSNKLKTLTSSNSEFLNYTLSELKASRINSNPYFLDLVNAFESVYLQYENVIKANKTFISQNFNATNKTFKLETIDDLYEKIKLDIFRLKAKVNTNTFSIVQWFNNYVEDIRQIKSEFNLLSILATNKIATKDEDKKQFVEAYQAAENILNQEKENKNKVKTIFGAITFAIGLISLIITITMLLIKLKTVKNNKILVYYLVSIAIEVVLLIAGITLLTLGLKGI